MEGETQFLPLSALFLLNSDLVEKSEVSFRKKGGPPSALHKFNSSSVGCSVGIQTREDTFPFSHFFSVNQQLPNKISCYQPFCEMG